MNNSTLIEEQGHYTVKEIAKILSQMIIKNYVKQLESNKCTKCGNFAFCQNYGISRGT